MPHLNASVPLVLDVPVDLANLLVLWSQASGLTSAELAVGVLRLGLHMLEDTASHLETTGREAVTP